MIELLSNQEMARAEALAIGDGTASHVLMENAGAGVVRMIQARFERGPVTVLCGPGNNGGDGYVIARLLQDDDWSVQVAALGDTGALRGDAVEMFRQWSGPTQSMSQVSFDGAGLVVDAVFGTGLNRPLEGIAARVVEQLNATEVPVVSVDVPSGLNGFGQAAGPAVRAKLTVTFFRRKPAHVLMPGRLLCGDVVTIEIGIAGAVLEEIVPRWRVNHPAVWRDVFPRPSLDGHKYSRGHALVVSGPLANGGAARLAARGALRVGAGLVTVACPPDAVIAHASQLNAIMTMSFQQLDEVLSDRRKNVLVLGPGNGVGAQTRRSVLTALGTQRACVIDADALTSFESEPEQDWTETLFAALHARCVLTPHDGEFFRLFPSLNTGSRLERALHAAQRSGAVVVLKGPDTVIAAPDGRAVVNTNAPPTLATAGSGDVLSGFVAGLLAQSMPTFEAACAAVWLHGRAAARFGPGLIAEDLPEILPHILAEPELSGHSPVGPLDDSEEYSSNGSVADARKGATRYESLKG